MTRDLVSALLHSPVRAINVGLESFTETLERQQVDVLHIKWKPPGDGRPETAWTLARLMGDKGDPGAVGSEIDRANKEAVHRIVDARPVLTGLLPAHQVWPDMNRRILHAGPPIPWARMCGPMQGAILGALMFEGWASSPEEARAMMDRGEIDTAPCHHYGAVCPMAGIISPNMSVWVVRNENHGNIAYSNLNEGLGRVLRFGAYDPEVIDRLKWMEGVLVPALQNALAVIQGGIDLRAVLAQALQMGDDGHNRNVAATSLLFRQLTLAVLRTDCDLRRASEVLGFIDGNNHFFLNLSMAAAKASLDAADGIERSTLVTAMSRNGVEFGIRISGLPGRWFTTPAPVPEGLYFAGFSEVNGNPDMGDSSITEAAGVGGFVMGSAPAMVQFVGGTARDALNYTREMMEITVAKNDALTLPSLDFVGAPTGIDIRKVLDTGILPVINTGIAHRQPGVGQVGAGIVRAPMACFDQALMALDQHLQVSE